MYTHTPPTTPSGPDVFTFEDGTRICVTRDVFAPDPREDFDCEVHVVPLLEARPVDIVWGTSDIEGAAETLWDLLKDPDALAEALSAYPGWAAEVYTLDGPRPGDWQVGIVMTEFAEDPIISLEEAVTKYDMWRNGNVWSVEPQGFQGNPTYIQYAETPEGALESFLEG